jgi:hypothetical protein
LVSTGLGRAAKKEANKKEAAERKNQKAAKKEANKKAAAERKKNQKAAKKEANKKAAAERKRQREAKRLLDFGTTCIQTPKRRRVLPPPGPFIYRPERQLQQLQM